MRIAFASVSDQLGGSEAVLLHLIEQVGRMRPGWDLRLLLPGDGPLAARASALGADVHVVPIPAALARVGEWGRTGRMLGVLPQLAAAAGSLGAYQSRFAAAVDAISPDILHTNGFKAHVVAARMRTHATRLWHIHEYVSRRPVTRRLLRHYGAVPDMIVANSLSVGRDVTSVVSERMRRPVRVVYNGVDVDRFTPEGPVLDLDGASGLPPAPPGTVRVGLAATFARWKGHETFLQSIAGLPADLPVRAYVIGGPLYDTDGSQWTIDELRARARALGVESGVGFTGFQSDMPAALRALDVVVHASTEPEPFGLVIAEAMAVGRAVITTGDGGAGEIVQAEETAVISAPGDAPALAAAIARLAREQSLRERLGRTARGAVVSRFSAERFGDTFVQIYESMR